MIDVGSMELRTYHEWGSIEHMLYLMKHYDQERQKWEDWLAAMVVAGEKYIQESTVHYSRHRKDFKRLVRWNNEAFEYDCSAIGDFIRLEEAFA